MLAALFSFGAATFSAGGFPKIVAVASSASAPELFAANSLVEGLNAIGGSELFSLLTLDPGAHPTSAVVAVGYGAATAVGLPVRPPTAHQAPFFLF